MIATLADPYVGPRPFTEEERIFGRDRERFELRTLLISERVALLYSPSGAGKTSLIRAGLTRDLLDAQFTVLPIIRVHLPLPPELATATAPRPNRYLISAIQSIEAGLRPAEPIPVAELAELTFDAYLGRRLPSVGSPDVALIFDQFEEILTLDATDQQAKAELFQQVGDALRGHNRWALFALREEHLAGLDPYVAALPTRARARMRLDLLTVDDARAAIQRPLEGTGVVFERAAADKLLDSLRRVRVQLPTGPEDRPGEYVEPVHLQVVCLRIWRQRGDAASIGVDQIGPEGDINRALGEYYDDEVRRIAGDSVPRQRAIRAWIEQNLMTPAGLRIPAFHEAAIRGGVADMMGPLVDAYLVRADRHRGTLWYELAHDRLIAPIGEQNARWFAANLSPFQHAARLWASEDQPESRLLVGNDLRAAEAWVAEHAGDLTDDEHDFLDACRRLRNEQEAGERRLRLYVMMAAVGAAVGLVLAAIMASLYFEAKTERQNAVAASAEAEAQRQDAVAAKVAAESERQNAVAARAAAVAGQEQEARARRLAQAGEVAATALAVLSFDPELSILLARRGVEMVADDPRAPARIQEALHRAVSTSRLQATLGGHTDEVTAVAYSPDRRWLASGSKDGTARVWDAERPTGPGREFRHRLDGEPTEVRAVAFDATGRLLLTAGTDGLVKVWDVDAGVLAGEPLRPGAAEADPERRPVNGIAVYRTGTGGAAGDTRVATAGADGTVRLWSLARRAELWRVRHPRSDNPPSDQVAVLAVAFSPDGRRLASGGADAVARVWDVDRRTEMTWSEPTSYGAASVAFSPDGQRLAVGHLGQTIQVVDVSGAPAGPAPEIVRLPGHAQGTRAVLFSPDPGGRWLVSAGGDRRVRFWEVRPEDGRFGNELFQLAGHTLGISGIAFHPDPARPTLATASLDGSARIWDQFGFAHDGELRDVAFSPDGRRIATASTDRFARIWDAAPDSTGYPGSAGGSPLLTLEHDRLVSRVVLSRDGTRVATASADRTAKIWNARTGVPLQILTGKHTDELNDVAFNHDGSLVATASRDFTAGIWDAASGQFLRSLRLDDWVYAVDFSPDGRLLATGDGTPTVTIWDTATWARASRFPLPNRSYAVTRIAFSPGGGRLAVATYEGQVFLLDATAALRASWQAHAGNVNSVAYSSDGKLLATAGQDGTVKLWDLADDARTPTLTLTLTLPDAVFAAAFDPTTGPTDRRLVTAGRDRQPHVFLLAPDRLLAYARSRVTRGLTAEECRRYLDREVCP